MFSGRWPGQGLQNDARCEAIGGELRESGEESSKSRKGSHSTEGMVRGLVLVPHAHRWWLPSW